MAITYPRAFPSMAFVDAALDVVYAQVAASTAGGQPQVASFGADLWKGAWTTAPLRETQAESFAAWVHSLRGGAKLFKAVHPLRRTAIAYPAGYGGMTKAGGGSFTGDAVLNAVAGTLDAVTLSGLPASFSISAGDLLSWSYGTNRQVLHRALETVTGNGSGFATFAVEPTVRPGFTLGATVALADPYFLAVLDPKSVRRRWQRGRLAALSFDAMQVL